MLALHAPPRWCPCDIFQRVKGRVALKHHTDAVNPCKEPKEAPVQGVLELLWNVLYRQGWLCMLLLNCVPVVHFDRVKQKRPWECYANALKLVRCRGGGGLGAVKGIFSCPHAVLYLQSFARSSLTQFPCNSLDMINWQSISEL